jgi:hypothetical protein
VKQGFKLNPYDGCVAKKIVKGKQITMCFHVDDCKLSHESSRVVDKTIKWLRAENGSIFEEGSGAMNICRGKVHKYLGECSWTSHTRDKFLLLCMTTWIESSRHMMRQRTSMMMDSYLSQNSDIGMRRQLPRIYSRWMRTVRSCWKRWQQTSTLLLQRHSM